MANVAAIDREVEGVNFGEPDHAKGAAFCRWWSTRAGLALARVQAMAGLLGGAPTNRLSAWAVMGAGDLLEGVVARLAVHLGPMKGQSGAIYARAAHPNGVEPRAKALLGVGTRGASFVVGLVALPALVPDAEAQPSLESTPIARSLIWLKLPPHPSP